MTPIEQRLGYVFENPSLLEEALTHTSYAHENHTTNNERLEYLGDAILQSSVSSLLYEMLPDSNEGQLSRARAKVVSTNALAAVARDLELGEDLKLGKGEEATGGRTKRRNLAATVESLLGAIFLDTGYDAAHLAVHWWLGSRLAELVAAVPDKSSPFKDPRTRLQEHTQRDLKRAPSYSVTVAEGPAHAPTFTVEVYLDEERIGVGSGSSKRDAAKTAAMDALVNYTREDKPS